MHKGAKRIFIAIVSLLFLSIALLGINFWATGFYEASFYMPESYYKRLNTVLTLPNAYGNEPAIWQFDRPFIDDYLPGHSLSELFTNYATIQSFSGWVIIKIYAKTNSAIGDLNKLIDLQYKDIAKTKNAAELQNLTSKLAALDNQIETLKKELLHSSSVNQIIERQAADKYIESFIAAAQSKETLRCLEALPQNRVAYLSFPPVAQDLSVKQLSKAQRCMEMHLMQLKSSGRSDCHAIATIEKEKLKIENKLDERINVLIAQIKTKAQVDTKLMLRLQRFLEEKTTQYSSFSTNFKQLETLFQDKLTARLKQQALLTEADINNNMIIVRVHKQFSELWLLFLLSATLLFTVAGFYYQKRHRQKIEPKSSSATDLSGLAQLITGKSHGAVAFFAQQAESAAAKFIMYLRKVVGLKIRIVLLDFSGKVIHKYTDNKKGIKDVLAQDIELDQIVYNDATIDIDIIMADGIGALDNVEKRQRFRHIMINCYQNYDLILYCVSEEVEVPINSFLPKDAIIVVVSSAFNDYDAKNWAKVLKSVGFRIIHFLKLA